ncbi:putative MFS transporter [Xylaria flabelliformis]|nr:putative MFS transporter [Xylaria flabelliformis]
MLRFHHLLLLFLGVLTSLATAASAPLFCKCTCFKNSTLIQLSGAQASCTQCTHAFCLSQNLPICKDVVTAPDGKNTNANAEVFSTCIQRDSRKDQIIVWGFILGTTGLLGWAAAKRIDEMRRQGKKPSVAPDRTPYAPVPVASD